MEILKMLSDMLSGNNAEPLFALLNALKNNSFNVKEALKNISPESLAPLFKSFSEAAKSETTSPLNGVTPIANIADREIVYALNRYLSSEIC